MGVTTSYIFSNIFPDTLWNKLNDMMEIFIQNNVGEKGESDTQIPILVPSLPRFVILDIFLKISKTYFFKDNN